MNFLMESRSDNELVEPRVSFDAIPITALRSRSREKISVLLNPEKVLVSEDGHSRDWRGIFTLSGLSQSEYAVISQSQDKINKLFDLWMKRNKETGTDVNLSQLQECFGIIDRYDVYDDTFLLFAEDAEAFILRSQSRDTTTNSSLIEIVQADPANDILTTADFERSEKNLPPKKYDAFVMYNDADVEFASQLIEKCENMGFDLCVKDRDLLGGLTMESEAILNLISKRCNRLIVIVSKAFLKSRMEVYISNFGQSVGISEGKRKIIPCVLEPCDLPEMLKFCFRLDYYRNNKLFDFWSKLEQSLKTSKLTKSPELVSNERFSMTEVDAASMNLHINIPSTPGPLYDREQVYRFTESPLLLEKAELENSLLEDKRKIWPPPPQLRGASSMLDISKLNPAPSSSRLKISQSTFHLNEDTKSDSGSETIKAKRKKWYKMFMPPSKSVIKKPNENVIHEEPEMMKPTDKRPWYEKIKKKKKKEKKEPVRES